MIAFLFSRRWTCLAVLGWCGASAGLGFWAGRQPATPAASSAPLSRVAAIPVSTVRARESRAREGTEVASLPGQRRAAELAQRARTDGERAVVEALQEKNRVRRGLWRNAALRGWAATAPDAAADWALRLPSAERANALAAVFAGAAERPAAAVRTGARVCAASADDAPAYGNLLIHALADRGAFSAAAEFATRGPAENRGSWLNTAFAEWGAYEPERAAAAVDRVGDPDAQRSAFDGLVTGWATADPAGLAQYAAQLPAGPARENGLAQALSRWALDDSVAVLEWIGQRPAEAAFDVAFSAIATNPDLVTARPDVAIQCAGAIVEPRLRASLLQMLAQSWGEKDRAGALRFLAASSDFNAVDRAALFAGVQAGSPP